MLRSASPVGPSALLRCPEARTRGNWSNSLGDQRLTSASRDRLMTINGSDSHERLKDQEGIMELNHFDPLDPFDPAEDWIYKDGSSACI